MNTLDPYMVRAERIELSTNAWQALILPLNYARALVGLAGLEPARLRGRF